mmetsp:Transcript_21908/g.41066  ORF Transcript_21908/g.41066 Transcript_21908/m.41066 type:complete len:217 (-) Transcript_21908:596-1246(-)
MSIFCTILRLVTFWYDQSMVGGQFRLFSVQGCLNQVRCRLFRKCRWLRLHVVLLFFKLLMFFRVIRARVHVFGFVGSGRCVLSNRLSSLFRTALQFYFHHILGQKLDVFPLQFTPFTFDITCLKFLLNNLHSLLFNLTAEVFPVETWLLAIMCLAFIHLLANFRIGLILQVSRGLLCCWSGISRVQRMLKFCILNGLVIVRCTLLFVFFRLFKKGP